MDTAFRVVLNALYMAQPAVETALEGLNEDPAESGAELRHLQAACNSLIVAQDGRCDLHLTQADLSEATGLSVVHVNRMLQELRARGLITFGHGRLAVQDWDKLARVGDFRSDYLHMREPPPPVV